MTRTRGGNVKLLRVLWITMMKFLKCILKYFVNNNNIIIKQNNNPKTHCSVNGLKHFGIHIEILI